MDYNLEIHNKIRREKNSFIFMLDRKMMVIMVFTHFFEIATLKLRLCQEPNDLQ